MIAEYTYRPTIASVEKKNVKADLARALIKISDEIHDCKDEEMKRKVQEILLQVL